MICLKRFPQRMFLMLHSFPWEKARGAGPVRNLSLDCCVSSWEGPGFSECEMTGQCWHSSWSIPQPIARVLIKLTDWVRGSEVLRCCPSIPLPAPCSVASLSVWNSLTLHRGRENCEGTWEIAWTTGRQNCSGLHQERHRYRIYEINIFFSFSSSLFRINMKHVELL